MRGVGPADKTGKLVVRYCPGGNSASPALRLPENPREIIAICNLFGVRRPDGALIYLRLRFMTLLKRRRAGALQIRQATLFDHKVSNAIYANTSSQICKDKRTLRPHSQCIR